MNIRELAASAALVIAVSPAGMAGQIKIDFDGAQSAAGSCSANNGIAEFIAVAQNTDAIPVSKARWGQSPEVPDPTCVGDDCDGNEGGSGGGNANNGGYTPPHQSGGGGYNPSNTFAATVCQNGQCSSITWQQAATKLSDHIIKKFVKEVSVYDYPVPIRLEFPLMDRPQIVKLLTKLETEMMKLVEKEIQNDISKIQTMPWDKPEDIARKNQIIKNDENVLKIWKNEAKKEAETNVNFYVCDPNDLRDWGFAPNGGKAYSDLGYGLQGKGWY